MNQTSIYGPYEAHLKQILEQLLGQIERASQEQKKKTGFKLYEHISARIKSSESMLDKCQRKGLPATTESALKQIRDSIGIRIICGFVDDIYQTVAFIKSLDGVSVYNEKDFVFEAKPNGYRSYHLILEVETPFEDCLGQILAATSSRCSCEPLPWILGLAWSTSSSTRRTFKIQNELSRNSSAVQMSWRPVI